MNHNVVVATHHKTGTVWMDGVFKAIAQDLGARYVDFRIHYERLDEALQEPFVLFNYDSDFRDHDRLLDRSDVRILHLVRDPRDVLISAMHYHRKSNETWLHEPVPGFDDVTYQRRLKSLRSDFERYVFEMEHSTAGTVRDMLRWRYDRPNAFEARYEDLRADAGLARWDEISAFLGFDAAERELSCRRFWQNSLFGGLTRLGNKHVRSGDVAQWRREFTPELGHAFLRRFPDALQSLGYEDDDRWVSRLKPGRSQTTLGDVMRIAALYLAVMGDIGRYI